MTREGTSRNEFYILHVEDEPEENEERIKLAVHEALAFYGISQEMVVWEYARDSKEALAKIEKAGEKWPDRPFDAVICDLKIPRSAADKRLDPNHGFEVIQSVSRKKWHCAIVVTTAFNGDSEILSFKEKLRQEEDVRIDEFLGKNSELGAGNQQIGVAKLRRILVPTEQFVAQSEEAGFLVVNAKQKDVLREIAFLAKKQYSAWPLAKILLLGDMGCGKNEFAKAFQRLLPQSPHGQRACELLVVNCASLQSSDLSGRIDLFGAENLPLGGRGLTNQPGCFEIATSYRGGIDGSGLAQNSGRDGINYDRAGVVFLDEFAELDPRIQAMILNALNEGCVRRTGSHTTVPIGCHVIFATNYDPTRMTGAADELDSGDARVRQDLVNRIPHVFRVPSLRERQDEIVPLICFMAGQRAKGTVTLSMSAAKMIQLAVGEEIITSIRDLQSIADVDEGETIITDANLTAVIRKAEVLGKSDSINHPIEERPVGEKAAALGLPLELQNDNLPKSTEWLIDRMYKVKLGLASRPTRYEFPDEETEHRYVMIGKLLSDQLKLLFWTSIDAHKTQLHRTNDKHYEFNARNQSEYWDSIVKMLLDGPR